MSAFVFDSTALKHDSQNRLGLPNDFVGFGISKHLSPLVIEAWQPLHWHNLPAVASTGRPADPFTKEGILFRFWGILELLNFSG